jgi:succinate dehydrogenase / fumarate reductase cytochrome b subunit
MLSLYRSDLGKKAVMAVTGIMLFGFVLGHMFGNLKLYLGAEALNHYAEWLREMGEPLLLWIVRVVMLGAVGLHILSATQLTLKNRRARPQDYAGRKTVQATYASRTMRWGGVTIALFILYHLAHFTFGPDWAHPDFVTGDVYHNVVSGFSVWWVSAFYILANLALGLHLYHGLWSMFQSLGWHAPGNPHDWRRRFAQVFALVIVAGNISFPLAVLSGLVTL